MLLVERLNEWFGLSKLLHADRNLGTLAACPYLAVACWQRTKNPSRVPIPG